MRETFGSNHSDVIIWQIHKLLNGASQPVSGKLESHPESKQTKKKEVIKWSENSKVEKMRAGPV